MLIQINPAYHRAEIIDGAAHIIVSIDQAGKATLRSFFGDRFDASYAAMPDDRLLQRELPKLLDELRGQIQGLAASELSSRAARHG